MNMRRVVSFLIPGITYLNDQPVWPVGVTPLTSDQITAADLPAAQAAAIAKAKATESDRIYAQYPAYAQTNAALGLYNALPTSDPFYPANLTAGIQAVLSAEHAAEDAINALTTSSAVDAFSW